MSPSWLRKLRRAPVPATSEAAFRAFLRRAGTRFEDAPIRDVLLAVMQFYREQRIAGLGDGPDTDMLLFEHGCYDWGDGEMFQLGLTRQFYSAEDNPISQLTTVFFYRPDGELRALGVTETWCHGPDELHGFSRLVLDSNALRTVQTRTPERRAIGWQIV